MKFFTFFFFKVCSVVFFLSHTAIAIGFEARLEPSEFELKTGVGTGPTLELLLSGISGDIEKRSIKIDELPVDDGSSIKFTPKFLRKDGTTERWVVQTELSGFSEPFEKEHRYATLTVDGAVQQLKFSVSAIEPPFQWDVFFPSGERSIWPNEGVPVRIRIERAPATNVDLGESDLVDSETKRSGNNGWKLCDAGTPSKCGPFASLAKGSHTFFLLPSDGVLIGSHTGRVTIKASESGAEKSAVLTIHGSDAISQIVGGAIIFLGGLISFGVSVVARSLTDRWSAQGFASEIMNHLQKQGRYLNDLQSGFPDGFDAPKIDRAISELIGQVDPNGSVLKGLLPPRVPNPFSQYAPEVLSAHLETCAQWVQVLDVALNRGLRMAEEFSKVPPQDLITGLESIDALFGDLTGASGSLNSSPALEKVLRVIAKVRSDLEAVVATSNITLSAAVQSSLSTSPKTNHQLQLGALHGFVWFLLLCLTTALGTYVLIYQDPGFGTAQDFLKCLFWGIGLPTGAALLSQNSSNVVTALKIELPQKT